MSPGESFPILDHIAFVVPSLERALQALGTVRFAVGEPQAYPSEGTRELYVGDPDQVGRLLLMQPAGEPGP
jgi:hypothetical protein